MKTIAGSFVIDGSSGSPCRTVAESGCGLVNDAAGVAKQLAARRGNVHARASAGFWRRNTGNDDGADPAAGGSNARALRLSSVDGQVRVVQDGQVIADPALANMPIFAGSEVTTGNDGRVEFQLEDGSVLRLSPNSTLSFPVLEKQGTGKRTPKWC